MSARLRSIITLLACILLLPTAISGGDNDAGTHADAGDTDVAPTPLSSWGTFTGALPQTDTDWYAGPNALSEGSCVTLATSASRDVDVTLRVGDHWVKSPAYKDESTTLSMAGPPGSTVLSGIVADDPTDDHTVAYTETLRARGLSGMPAADLGTGNDAGGTITSAMPMMPGCYAGRLNPLTFDNADVYSFAGQSGADVVVSVAAATGIPLNLQVLDGNGVLLASQLSTAGPLSLSLPSTSTFYVTTSSSNLNGLTDYALSLIGGGGPPSPCRPTCLVS